MKASLLSSFCICLVLSLAFVPSRKYFVTPSSRQPASVPAKAQGHESIAPIGSLPSTSLAMDVSLSAPPPANPTHSRSSTPAQDEQYVATIILPTYPPQTLGSWDPLKAARQELAR